MGPGGWWLLCLMGLALAWFLYQEWPRTLAAPSPSSPDRVPLVLEEAPAERVASLTPPWQVELTGQLEAEGFERLGDFAYAATEFFWARIFLTPDRKAALLLVNWKEGGKYGAPLTSNLEIYSFGSAEGKGDFRLTACAQDGSTRLLTGANRPSPRQMTLHLKMVFNAVGVKPLLAEHEQRLLAWEREGARVQALDSASTLRALAGLFSGGA